MFVCLSEQLPSTNTELHQYRYPNQTSGVWVCIHVHLVYNNTGAEHRSGLLASLLDRRTAQSENHTLEGGPTPQFKVGPSSHKSGQKRIIKTAGYAKESLWFSETFFLVTIRVAGGGDIVFHKTKKATNFFTLFLFP